jgi:hypothetical protein
MLALLVRRDGRTSFMSVPSPAPPRWIVAEFRRPSYVVPERSVPNSPQVSVKHIEFFRVGTEAPIYEESY